MVSFVAMYHSLLLKLLTNKEATFNCNHLIRPMTPFIYHGGIGPLLKIIASKAIPPEAEHQQDGGKTQLHATDSDETRMNIVTIDSMDFEEQKMDSKNLYIFVYDTPEKYDEMVCHYNQCLTNGEILTVCMDSTSYKFILNVAISPGSIVTMEVRDVGRYWMRSLVPMFLVAFLGLIHYVCVSVVEHISKFDPVFADFDIASSNIIKFKDLLKAPMSQCSICFEEFIPEDDVRVLDCKHYYHPACIDRWLIGHSKRCPCCRNNIEINEKV